MLVTTGVWRFPVSGPPKTQGEGRRWWAGVCAGALKEVFGWGPLGRGPRGEVQEKKPPLPEGRGRVQRTAGAGMRKSHSGTRGSIASPEAGGWASSAQRQGALQGRPVHEGGSGGTLAWSLSAPFVA